MRKLKKHLKHFLLFSFVFFALSASVSAAPDFMGGAPSPQGQETSGAFSPPVEPPAKFDEGEEKMLPPPNDSSERPEPPKDSEGRYLPPKDADSIIKYRGNRTYSENLPLKVIQSKSKRLDNGLVSLDLIFNQNINPRSVRINSILINNAPLPSGIRFAFNRKGDTIKIIFPMNYSSFKVKILKIRSFNGNSIEPVEFLVEVERAL